MSWTTGTQTEALAASSANGSAVANTQTPTGITPAGALAYLPANFWLPTYGVSKAILVKAFGVIGTTATPSLTLELLANTTQGTRNTSGIVATTGATAAPASGSNMPWELDIYLSCASTGATGTVLASGLLKIYPTSTTVETMRISSSSANPNTALTLSTQSAYYLELYATWSASSSSDTIQCYGYTALGLN